MSGNLANRIRSLPTCIRVAPVLFYIACWDDQKSDTNTEPPPHGQKAYLFVEIDWHERLLDPNDPLSAGRDISQFVQLWRSSILAGAQGTNPLGCEYRYNSSSYDMSVTTILSDQVNWNSRSLLDAAQAAGYDRSLAGTANLMGDWKSNLDKLPNLYLLGAEFFDVDPATTAYTWPNVTHFAPFGVTLLNLQSCGYSRGSEFPVGAVFVSEIEKLVTDMNAYSLSTCGALYDFRAMLGHTVSHELFHELFLPEYPPVSPYTYCHDGDAVCKCVMNQTRPSHIKALVDAGNCSGARTVLTNWSNACMDRSHDFDGCSGSDIVFHNVGNPSP